MRSTRSDLPSGHQRLDARSLALHRAVAARLRERPELLAVAIENLDRWAPTTSARSADALREWRDLLTRWTLDRVLDFIVSDSDEAARLRQSSPFAGILDESERLAIMRTFAVAP